MSSPARAFTVLIAVALLGLAVIVTLALQRPDTRAAGGSTSTPATHPTSPEPALSPAEAVTAILAALRDNDAAAGDQGIRTTFRFASPANQAVTGPVERFITMLKRPPYAALLNHRAASVRPLDDNGTRAALLVTIVDHDGRRARYLWVLSKQADGPQKDCWMTDAVSPARPPPGERDDADRI